MIGMLREMKVSEGAITKKQIKRLYNNFYLKLLLLQFFLQEH